MDDATSPAAGVHETFAAYVADYARLQPAGPAALGDAGSWTQLNEWDLTDVEQPVLPDGFRFRTADEAGPKAVVQAHLDA